MRKQIQSDLRRTILVLAPFKISAKQTGDAIYGQIILTSITLILLCMGVHHEALRLASSRLIASHIPPRLNVSLAVLIALAAHFVEVVIFSIGWHVLLQDGVGSLSSAATDMETLIYFSLVTYTSLGYGDVIPIGPIRLLAGIESLVGLVLIAWTASFTYLEMRRYWFTTEEL